MFQSFPLGDRSSVNLRGEYHAENVTVFEKPQLKEPGSSDVTMEIDRQLPEVPKSEEVASEKGPLVITKTEGQDETLQGNDPSAKTVKFKVLAEAPREVEPNTDILYPLFWSLQEDFSQPTRLFDPQTFQSFQSGLDLTLRKFKAIQQEQKSRGPSKLPSDPNRPPGRKRSDSEADRQELANSFNPRYLTSRDLFELELSDLAFRRYILVQSLILVDFLLSLTPKAKRKLEHTSNKSVLYNHSLNGEEIKWATTVRAEIALYLQQGPEGKFYYRMVDTVLSRDKNWVHWKAESCPPIELQPVSAESFLESEQSAKRVCTSKRLRPTPMGSLDLHFLSQTGENADKGFDELKHPDRYSVPKAEDFKGPILDDELDIDMAKTDEAKEAAIVAKASKIWRTLRIASKNRLTVFDKIEDGGDLAPLFELPKGEQGEQDEKEKTDDLDVERVGDEIKVEEVHLDGVEKNVAAQPAVVEAT